MSKYFSIIAFPVMWGLQLTLLSIFRWTVRIGWTWTAFGQAVWVHAAHETPSDETHYSALGNNLQIAYKSFIQDACRRLGHTRGLVSKQTECILQPQSMSHLCACTYCCGHAVLLLQVSHTNWFGYLFQVSPESAYDTILRRRRGRWLGLAAAESSPGYSSRTWVLSV